MSCGSIIIQLDAKIKFSTDFGIFIVITALSHIIMIYEAVEMLTMVYYRENDMLIRYLHSDFSDFLALPSSFQYFSEFISNFKHQILLFFEYYCMLSSIFYFKNYIFVVI